MNLTKEKPAVARGGAGFPLSQGLGGFHENSDREPTRTPPADQPWSMAREYERQSIGLARSALLMRGADRFQSLAIASALALAARDAALIAGAMQ